MAEDTLRTEVYRRMSERLGELVVPDAFSHDYYLQWSELVSALDGMLVELGLDMEESFSGTSWAQRKKPMGGESQLKSELVYRSELAGQVTDDQSLLVQAIAMATLCRNSCHKKPISVEEEQVLVNTAISLRYVIIPKMQRLAFMLNKVVNPKATEV